jgi:hypothetical protein
MSNLIKKQAAGSLTVTEFCQRHRIKPSKFFYWKNKMKECGKSPARDSQSPNGSAGGFIPISLPGMHRNTEFGDKIELYFPSGLRACIPASTGEAVLKTIIKACGN